MAAANLQYPVLICYHKRCGIAASARFACTLAVQSGVDVSHIWVQRAKGFDQRMACVVCQMFVGPMGNVLFWFPHSGFLQMVFSADLGWFAAINLQFKGGKPCIYSIVSV